MSVVNMSKKEILDGIKTSTELQHIKIAQCIEYLANPITSKKDSLVNDTVELIQQFNNNAINKEYTGIGILVLVKINGGKIFYSRPVAACGFLKEYEGIYVIDYVASFSHTNFEEEKDKGTEEKERIKELLGQTFCTYLMAYTNNILKFQFRSAVIYLLNIGDEKGFKCYTPAACFAGMQQIIIIPFKNKISGFLREVNKIVRGDDDKKLSAFKKLLNEANMQIYDDTENLSAPAKGWYTYIAWYIESNF